MKQISVDEAVKLYIEGGHFIFIANYLYYSIYVEGNRYCYYQTYGPLPVCLIYANGIDSKTPDELRAQFEALSKGVIHLYTFEQVLRMWGFCGGPHTAMLELADQHHVKEFGFSLLEKLTKALPSTPEEQLALSSSAASKRFVAIVLDELSEGIGEVVYQSDRYQSLGEVTAVKVGKLVHNGKDTLVYEWPAPIVEIIDKASSKIIPIRNKEDAKAIVEALQRKFDLT